MMLFENKTELSPETMKYIKDNYKGEDYCKKQYDKLKDNFPVRFVDILYMDADLILDYMHASAYYLYDNRISLTGNKELDENNLIALLNRDIRFAFDEKTKELTKQGQGLGFLNSFIKEKLLSVTVANKGNKNVRERLQDIKYCYKVARKCISFKCDLSLQKLFASTKLVGGQSVSNFRPLASAYLMYKYGILEHPEKDTLNFWIPSEGWLGRLLSSYYIAYKFPNKQINYLSTDPSGDVVSSFWEMVEYLSNYGIHPLTNWHAEIRQHGSDVEEANFHKNENKVFDLIWTSPPYSLGYEKYKDSYIMTALDANNKEVSIVDKNGNYLSEEYKLDSGQKVKEVVSGDDFIYRGNKYTLIRKRNVGQSSSKAITNFGWNERFFRPSVLNAKSNIAKGGTMIWNVANVITHKTLEDDVVRICQEEDFELIDTLKYSLSRTPGGIIKDGKRVALREIKPLYEPVFVFKLKGND